jgi:hypothetical protein
LETWAIFQRVDEIYHRNCSIHHQPFVGFSCVHTTILGKIPEITVDNVVLLLLPSVADLAELWSNHRKFRWYDRPNANLTTQSIPKAFFHRSRDSFFGELSENSKWYKYR